MASSTSLPTIKSPRPLPGAVHLPGVTQRDPITGTITPYEMKYADPEKVRGKTKYGSARKSIHDLSVFESTGYQRGYFIIHPQWTSEASGAKRLSVRERRGHHSWDCRPSVPALLDRYTQQTRRKPLPPSPGREQLMGETVTRQTTYEAQLSSMRQTPAPAPAPSSAKEDTGLHQLMPGADDSAQQPKKFTYY